MKRLKLRVAACAWMTLAGLAWAEPEAEEHPLRIELDLVDGSRVVGAPAPPPPAADRPE